MRNSPDQAEVSILIPAYMAAQFIDRTLLFARGQTFANVTIVISIDKGDDNTTDIARRHATSDPRIVVHEQEQRLGWVGNVNFLLERVDTSYFFVYFHDDILLPQYTAHMLENLQAQPQAAGVYCDMGHFGATDHISRGPAYGGSITERLLTLMLVPQRGSPLRALLRTEPAGHLRLPNMGSGGFWANEPFLMDMLVAGPLGHVAEVLYLRWDQREGSLTDGWNRMAIQDIVNGWKTNIQARLDIIESATSDPSERAALACALYLQVFPMVKDICNPQGEHIFPSSTHLHLAFATPGTSDLFATYGPAIESWARERFAQCQV